MADLRSRFIEDYAGGLLNISRQELTSTGEVLSQDGLLSDASLFVEDGSGSKSGLKLGIAIVESVDPTTEEGVVNVRYADRTYASIRDLKIFSTAVASAQAALSDAATSSISNLENAFLLLEESQRTSEAGVETRLSVFEDSLDQVRTIVGSNTGGQTLDARVDSLEASLNQDTSNLGALRDIINNFGLFSKAQFGPDGPVETIKFKVAESEQEKSNGTYVITGLTASTSGGSGLNVTVTVSDNVVSSVVVNNGGTNFKLGDKVTIAGSSSGNGGDITLEVRRLAIVHTDLGALDPTKFETLADEVQKLIVKLNDVIDILNPS